MKFEMPSIALAMFLYGFSIFILGASIVAGAIHYIISIVLAFISISVFASATQVLLSFIKESKEVKHD